MAEIFAAPPRFLSFLSKLRIFEKAQSLISLICLIINFYQFLNFTGPISVFLLQVPMQLSQYILNLSFECVIVCFIKYVMF